MFPKLPHPDDRLFMRSKPYTGGQPLDINSETKLAAWIYT